MIDEDREGEKLRDRLTKRQRRPRLQIMKEPTSEPALSGVPPF